MSVGETRARGPIGREILDLFLGNDRQLELLDDEIGCFILKRQPTEGYKRPSEMYEPLFDKMMPVRQIYPDEARASILGIDLLVAASSHPDTDEEIIHKWIEVMKGKPFDTNILFYRADGELELFDH